MLHPLENYEPGARHHYFPAHIKRARRVIVKSKMGEEPLKGRVRKEGPVKGIVKKLSLDRMLHCHLEQTLSYERIVRKRKRRDPYFKGIKKPVLMRFYATTNAGVCEKKKNG